MGGIVGIERVVVIFPERGRESAYHMSGPPGEIHHMTVGVSRVHNLATEHLMRLLEEWAFTLCITEKLFEIYLRTIENRHSKSSFQHDQYVTFLWN